MKGLQLKKMVQMGMVNQVNRAEYYDETSLLKPYYRKLLAAQDNDSDSTDTLKKNKVLRKEARKEARQDKEALRDEDPFLYYFGVVDRDKVKEFQ